MMMVTRDLVPGGVEEIIEYSTGTANARLPKTSRYGYLPDVDSSPTIAFVFFVPFSSTSTSVDRSFPSLRHVISRS